MIISAREKFQTLLRDLFEFDCAELDFGIYRIMNHKRQVVERFITEDLPQAIAEELQRGALAEQGQAQQALAAARQKVLDALDADALDADGNLAETYRNTPPEKPIWKPRPKPKAAAPQKRWRPPSTTTSTLPSAVTGRTATLSPDAATPRKSATPSPTTARKSPSTGPTTTSTTSRPASISPITPVRPPMA